jgi:hypothetical protein
MYEAQIDLPLSLFVTLDSCRWHSTGGTQQVALKIRLVRQLVSEHCPGAGANVTISGGAPNRLCVLAKFSLKGTPSVILLKFYNSTKAVVRSTVSRSSASPG